MIGITLPSVELCVTALASAMAAIGVPSGDWTKIISVINDVYRHENNASLERCRLERTGCYLVTAVPLRPITWKNVRLALSERFTMAEPTVNEKP